MPVPRFADLPWPAVDAFDRHRTVCILPVGATEAHGPHLPLCTDVVIAGAMAEAGGERLAERDLLPLLLPPLAYTAAPFAAAFAGTLSPSPEAISELLVGIARSLAAHGFGILAIANAHLDPAHLRALHAGVGRILEERLLLAVFPDLTRKPWALRLGDEFKSGACHAGQFETSVVLAARPDLVRDDERAALPANPSSLSVAIREGRKSFAEAGGPRAYFGDPAAASVAEGRATIAALGDILAEAVTAALGSARS